MGQRHGDAADADCDRVRSLQAETRGSARICGEESVGENSSAYSLILAAGCRIFSDYFSFPRCPIKRGQRVYGATVRLDHDAFDFDIHIHTEWI
jgi:hypothetical protein